MSVPGPLAFWVRPAYHANKLRVEPDVYVALQAVFGATVVNHTHGQPAGYFPKQARVLSYGQIGFYSGFKC